MNKYSLILNAAEVGECRFWSKAASPITKRVHPHWFQYEKPGFKGVSHTDSALVSRSSLFPACDLILVCWSWLIHADMVHPTLSLRSKTVQDKLMWVAALHVQVQHPVLIRNTSMAKLWYKPDTKFGMPKAYIQLHFNCPESNYSPEASVLTDIFTKLVADNLNEYGKRPSFWSRLIQFCSRLLLCQKSLGFFGTIFRSAGTLTWYDLQIFDSLNTTLLWKGAVQYCWCPINSIVSVRSTTSCRVF